MQPRWQHNTLFLCICWHSVQSSGSGTWEGLNVLLLVTLCSLTNSPPRQDPKPLKDHFLVFVFNVNSEASICVQCEIIPNLKSDNPSFFLCLFKRLGCGYCGASFLATYPTAGWRWSLSHLQFYMVFMFWQDGTTKISAPYSYSSEQNLCFKWYLKIFQSCLIFSRQLCFKIVQKSLIFKSHLGWRCNLVFVPGAGVLVPVSSCGTFLVLHTLQWVSCWPFGFCSVISPCFKRCKKRSQCFHAWFVISSTPKSLESASWVIFLLPELCKRFASGDSRESWGFSRALLNSLQSKCQFEVKELEI